MGKLMSEVKKKNVEAVKQCIAKGENPNTPTTGRNVTTPYLYAVMCSVWNEVSPELLEIVTFLTPHITDHYYRDLDGNDFNGNMFYSSYFGDLMSISRNIGDKDPTIEAMLSGGYCFDKEPNFGRYIGTVSFPLAKKMLEQFGIDDGTSVVSAAKAHNVELVSYLLEQGASPNQPIYSSNGSQSTALTTAIAYGNETIVKLLLEAGADPKIKDTGYEQDAFEMAESSSNDTIVALLQAAK